MFTFSTPKKEAPPTSAPLSPGSVDSVKSNRGRVKRRVKRPVGVNKEKYDDFRQAVKDPLVSVLPNNTRDEVDEIIARLWQFVPVWSRVGLPNPKMGFFPLLMDQEQSEKFQSMFEGHGEKMQK